MNFRTMLIPRQGKYPEPESPNGAKGRAPGQGSEGFAVKLKGIHFFDAQSRAKFGLSISR